MEKKTHGSCLKILCYPNRKIWFIMSVDVKITSGWQGKRGDGEQGRVEAGGHFCGLNRWRNSVWKNQTSPDPTKLPVSSGSSSKVNGGR